MKKLFYLASVVILACSCATGYYAPHNINQFGTQTQVILSEANFRIVRHLEVVIDINNTNLKRADVEKSAYAELIRRANLTGSQALINVVIEEVRREKTHVIPLIFGVRVSKITQHVAARGTIIEFLDKNGNPIQSETNQGTAPRASIESSTQSHVQQPSNEVKKEDIKPHAPVENQNQNHINEPTTVIPDNTFEGLDKEDILDPQKTANDCYIACLIKGNFFKQSAKRQLLDTLCDSEHIKKLVSKYDYTLLKKCGKYHDRKLNIYGK